MMLLEQGMLPLQFLLHLGMAVARDLKNENKKLVAVIGDGAMTGGMAYEAMNNSGVLISLI